MPAKGIRAQKADVASRLQRSITYSVMCVLQSSFRRFSYFNATHALMNARQSFWIRRVHPLPAFLIYFLMRYACVDHVDADRKKLQYFISLVGGQFDVFPST